MHIELSRNSSVKLYLQIAKTLAHRIQSGLLPQGTKLPSVRHLSTLLAVSPVAVDILTRLCDTHPPKLIYTIPTFHNPTGVTLPTVRRTKLLDLAQSYHCLILRMIHFPSCTIKQSRRFPLRLMISPDMWYISKALAKPSLLAAV